MKIARSAAGRRLRHLAMISILAAISGCSAQGHLFPPDSPENPSAVFTEDIFGTDGVMLDWEDPNDSDDIGFTIYRDGLDIALVEPLCDDGSGELVCAKFTSYVDTDVARGETHCYAVSAHYYDWVDDLIFGESDKSPDVCITIPMEGFTGAPSAVLRLPSEERS